MWHLVILAIGASALNDKCRILAVGGGTDVGAYTAGAIIGLVENLPVGEAEWDVVTGIGDGAFNAYILAQQSLGNEKIAAEALRSFWSDFSASDFYEDWPGWIVTGLLLESGLYNAKNMYDQVDKLGLGSFKRFLGVGTTDVVSGSYVFFNTTNGRSFDSMKTGVKASASKAGVFPYVAYSNLKLISGNLKYTVDILHGINACLEQGYTDSQITVDIIICSGKDVDTIDAKGYKTLQVLYRYLDIWTSVNALQVVTNAEHDHPAVTIRSKIYPSQKIQNNIYPYDYTSAQIQEMLELGISDAKNSVSEFIAFSI